MADNETDDPQPEDLYPQRQNTYSQKIDLESFK